MDAGSQVFSINNVNIVRPNLSVTETLGFIREKIYSTNDQPFSADSLGVNNLGSKYYSGVTIVDTLGSNTPTSLADAQHRSWLESGLADRRLSESLDAFGQRHLDAGQAHRGGGRKLVAYAVESARPASRRGGHHLFGGLRPVRAGPGHRQRRLQHHHLPARQRRPLLPRQPDRPLFAGQVPDPPQPEPDGRRPLRH